MNVKCGRTELVQNSGYYITGRDQITRSKFHAKANISVSVLAKVLINWGLKLTFFTNLDLWSILKILIF